LIEFDIQRLSYKPRHTYYEQIMKSKLILLGITGLFIVLYQYIPSTKVVKNSPTEERKTEQALLPNLTKYEQLNPINKESSQAIDLLATMPLISEIQHRFNTTQDLYSFSQELIHYSKNGDSETQFYLGKIIQFCETALALAGSTNNEIGLTLELHLWWRNRCSSFSLDNIYEFGKAEKWLELSSAGGYAPAIIYSLYREIVLVRDQNTLDELHYALKSQHSDVYLYLGDLSTSITTTEAWKFIACEHGYDCTRQSKEMWRFGQAAYCEVERFDSRLCDTDIGYIDYVQSRLSSDDFKNILIKKKSLQKILTSGNIDSMSLDMILD
jgi:hypothetical protein